MSAYRRTPTLVRGWHGGMQHVKTGAGQNAVFAIPEDRRPIIPVRIFGPNPGTALMMLDSGNDVSLIGRADAMRLGLTPDNAHPDRNIKVAGISQNPMPFYLYGHVPIQIGNTPPVSIPIAVGDVKDNLLGRERVRHAYDSIITRDRVILRRRQDVPIANTNEYDYSHQHLDRMGYPKLARPYS